MKNLTADHCLIMTGHRLFYNSSYGIQSVNVWDSGEGFIRTFGGTYRPNDEGVYELFYSTAEAAKENA